LPGRLIRKPRQGRVLARQKVFDRISRAICASQSRLAALVSLEFIGHIGPQQEQKSSVR
jgi:hypothetical protein